LEFRIEIEMEEVATAPVGGPGPEGLEALVASTSGPGPKAPVIEGNSTTNSNDADFFYDRTRFHKCKAHRRFKDDYN
jgi:hypothetical protein